MKKIFTKANETTIVITCAIALFLGVSAFAIAKNSSDEKIKIKITKIVDGDTTVIEKELKESEMKNISKGFDSIKGKNVQVFVETIGDKNPKAKNTNSFAYNFNFSDDGDTAKEKSKSITRKIIIDDNGKKYTTVDINVDSLLKNVNVKLDMDIDKLIEDAASSFYFETEDGELGEVVIIHDGKETHISANAKDRKTTVKKSESESGNAEDSKDVTVIISENGKEKKKVIIKSSVRVKDEKKHH